MLICERMLELNALIMFNSNYFRQFQQLIMYYAQLISPKREYAPVTINIQFGCEPGKCPF